MTPEPQSSTTPTRLRMGTPQGRGALFALIIGSGMSFLEGLVLNVALPKIDDDIHLGVSGMQWAVSGYLLAIAALLLLGGSLGDLYGRRKVYLIGLVVFVASSVVGALSPSAELLIGARFVQGIGGALMIPASLAIIQAVFDEADRSAAIGAWTGFSAIFTALGPFAGGALVEFASWRVAFFINVPLGALCLWAALRWVPETHGGEDDATSKRRPDLLGAMFAALGLAGLSYWAIEGAGRPLVSVQSAVGLGGLVAIGVFAAVERRVSNPMLPAGLFRNHQIVWVNLSTLLFYGGFVTGLTLLTVRLQTALGYGPLLAGVSGLPINFFLLTLSKKMGDVSQKIGPRIPMAVGAVVLASALWVISTIDTGDHYFFDVFGATLLCGLGMSIAITPLTAAALAAADERHTGVASAVNNAASRLGSAVVISVIPLLAGIPRSAAVGGEEFSKGFPSALHVAAGICLSSAFISVAFVRRPASNK